MEKKGGCRTRDACRKRVPLPGCPITRVLGLAAMIRRNGRSSLARTTSAALVKYQISLRVPHHADLHSSSEAWLLIQQRTYILGARHCRPILQVNGSWDSSAPSLHLMKSPLEVHELTQSLTCRGTVPEAASTLDGAAGWRARERRTS
jgi:hypothetical protein